MIVNPEGAEPVTVSALHAVAYGCEGDLADNSALVGVTRQAVLASGLTIMSDAVHAFVPHGLTVALILAQSHLVVSTWPELRVATVDVAACTSAEATMQVWQMLAAYLRPSRQSISDETLDLGVYVNAVHETGS